jgi:Gas vesicle synthesis protein GvpL/GvpF
VISTYLYCFIRPPADSAVEERDQPSGIDDAEVRRLVLPLGGEPRASVAWVSTMRTPDSTAAHLIEHDRVCTVAVGRGYDVLPARFGQTFEDDAALAADYLGRAPSLRAVWAHVAHAVEMTLTLTLLDDAPTRDAAPSDVAPSDAAPVAPERPSAARADEPDPVSVGARTEPREAASAGTGYAYLTRVAGPIRARQRARERIEPFRVAVRAAAGALIRDEAVRSQSLPSAVAVSHLVDRGAMTAYRSIVAEVAVAHPAIRVLFSGPYAPYSFVSIDSGARVSTAADQVRRERGR